MLSNMTLPEQKSSLSQEDLSNLVCGMTIFSILLLMICFICVLWKINSDEEIIQSHENLRTLLQRKRHRAPNNSPVGSIGMGQWET